MTGRCAADRERVGEPLSATASTVSAFVLLEDPGPWGPHVLQSRRLPDAVRGAARHWKSAFGVRTLLIRRPGRTPEGPRRVFVVNPRLRWAETVVVDDLAAVAGWTLAGVASAGGVGLPRHEHDIFLVCTHGRHDPCCAERGRPLAAAIAAEWPDLLWEASHVGGDRFAGNLVALPRGDYFGGLDPQTGPDAVRKYVAGEIDLEHHRGRSTQAWPVQAAEHALRVRLGLQGVEAVQIVAVQRERGATRVGMSAVGRAWEAVVRVEHGASRPLTCHAQHTDAPPRFLVDWV